MKCEDVQNKLVDLQMGFLEHQHAQEMETHLAGCMACREESKLFSGTWAILNEWRPVEPSAAFRARFWEKVREEENQKSSWFGFPRLVPVFAGFLGVWIAGVSIGATLFLRAHDGSLIVTQTDSSLATAYLKRAPQRTL